MILINGRFLTQRLTGVQRFAYEISKQLVAINSEIRIILPLSFKNNLTAQIKKDFTNNLFFWGKGSGLIWEQVSLTAYSKKNVLLLNFCNSSPILWSNKLTCVHDMSYKANPQWFSKKMGLYYSFLIPAVLKTSKYIITVSNFAKNEIIKYVPSIPADKITVVYNACSDIFKNEGYSPVPEDQSNNLIFVGSVEPRKNLKSLLNAFYNLENKNISLTIVGAKNATIFKEVNIGEEIDARVTWKTNCSDDELKQLYLEAKAIINPSYYEGFGVPLIEAANNSCVLVLSDIEVFKEIAGDNAIYFNAGNIKEIENAIKKVVNLTNEQVVNITQTAYEDITKRFDWKKSAFKIYNLVADEYI